MIPRIVSAKIDGDSHNLIVAFTDGAKRRYNAARLFQTGNFERLKNWGYFKNFQIERTGAAIIWDDSTDISEHEIYTSGEPIT